MSGDRGYLEAHYGKVAASIAKRVKVGRATLCQELSDAVGGYGYF